MKWEDIDGNPLHSWKRRIFVLFEWGRFRVFWAWFDFWIGFYPNMNKKLLYVTPFPMLVFQVPFGGREHKITMTSYKIDGVEQLKPVTRCKKCGHPASSHKCEENHPVLECGHQYDILFSFCSECNDTCDSTTEDDFEEVKPEPPKFPSPISEVHPF